jgi:SAM-dependent methyltransferase
VQWNAHDIAARLYQGARPGVKIAESWTYPGGDSCADFFTGYLKATDPDVPANANVLEIGCEEFDWLDHAKACWPKLFFTGIDWSLGERTLTKDIVRMGGDVRWLALFPDNSFDLIVSISAIEHVGLGHYASDPLDPDGDTLAITNAFRWLKPGGWLLFDVPYDPTGYRVQGTECRVYDDDALVSRLWVDPLVRAKATARWHTRVYCEANNTPVLIEKPEKACEPFHYVGVGWQKCPAHDVGCRCLACG